LTLIGFAVNRNAKSAYQLYWDIKCKCI